MCVGSTRSGTIVSFHVGLTLLYTSLTHIKYTSPRLFDVYSAGIDYKVADLCRSYSIHAQVGRRTGLTVTPWCDSYELRNFCCPSDITDCVTVQMQTYFFRLCWPPSQQCYATACTVISVDVPSVFLFLEFGTNYPSLSGSPTHWLPLNFDKNAPRLFSHPQRITTSVRPATSAPQIRLNSRPLCAIQVFYCIVGL